MLSPRHMDNAVDTCACMFRVVSNRMNATDELCCMRDSTNDVLAFCGWTVSKSVRFFLVLPAFTTRTIEIFVVLLVKSWMESSGREFLSRFFPIFSISTKNLEYFLKKCPNAYDYTDQLSFLIFPSKPICIRCSMLQHLAKVNSILFPRLEHKKWIKTVAKCQK